MRCLALQALAILAITCGGSVPGLAQRATKAQFDTVQLGAIRWDNWRLGSSAATALDDPASRQRVPYFATRLPGGELGFPGDSVQVADADVHYARAAGIDFFIFGYYLETASWGRNPGRAAALNRALEAYLKLDDHLGVRFALSFNWNFPATDVAPASEAIARVLRHGDYVRTNDGAAVVFFFVPNLQRWLAGFGGEAGSAQAIVHLRQQVRTATGSELYLVGLLFGLPKAAPTAMGVGFDAVSTYANALGTGGQAVPYARCAATARQAWRTAADATTGGFLPTVTLGWDYRPALRDSAQATRARNPDWCEPATDNQWIEQLRAAATAAIGNPRNRRFPGVVLYAWNEFLEGGWIAPTLTEGVRRIAVIADAFGRHRSMPSFVMTWPARVNPLNCRILNGPKTQRDAGAGCGEMDDAMTMGWPCPPGMHTANDLLRQNPPEGAALRAGIWHERRCAPG